ncbi:hypothetical protein BV898_19430 [Hypsibius exemplaris]|uniref:Uncharacterized protein n=1 Tax=Hypsibius exemplaris TaxID=2072580 RepID=A0A9X6NJ80_HYPEX|nr:hypothetical protein BV898_19430 [Hypsibius exemplaris]
MPPFAPMLQRSRLTTPFATGANTAHLRNVINNTTPSTLSRILWLREGKSVVAPLRGGEDVGSIAAKDAAVGVRKDEGRSCCCWW